MHVSDLNNILYVYAMVNAWSNNWFSFRKVKSLLLIIGFHFVKLGPSHLHMSALHHTVWANRYCPSNVAMVWEKKRKMSLSLSRSRSPAVENKFKRKTDFQEISTTRYMQWQTYQLPMLTNPPGTSRLPLNFDGTKWGTHSENADLKIPHSPLKS